MRRAPNFDRVAHIYRWIELVTFRSSLWGCRCTFLDELHSCRNALVIGDGDGRFTARLLEMNPSIRIDAVDASREMLLALLRNAGANANRVHTYQADAREWVAPHPPYDAIVTHFFLDCLSTDEVSTIAQLFHICTTPSSRWVVSEFAIPRNWFGRLVAQPVVTFLYLAFRLLTGIQVLRLPNHRDALTQAGFKLNLSRNILAGLLVSEMWVLEPKTTRSTTIVTTNLMGTLKRPLAE
jgi:ubiquinone/menaquinone biosynthesis C-methylase UbiE